MIWLAIHMWVLLFAAFCVGVATGLWMRSAAKKSSSGPTETPMGTLDIDAPKSSDNG